MRSKVIYLVSTGAALVLLVSFLTSVDRETGSSDGMPPPGAIPAEEARQAPQVVERFTLHSGSTMDDLLKEAGLETDLRQIVLLAMEQEIDLRRIPAGTGLCVSRNRDGRPARVAVRTEKDRFLRFEPAGETTLTEEIVIPVQVEVLTGTGIVEYSVSRAFRDLPDAVTLIASFADIFQWDIDLLVEPRKGDLVRIVYESLHYGELPDDLPPFRGELPRSGDPAGLGRILAARYQGELAESAAYLVEGRNSSDNYFNEDGTPLRKTFLKSPLNYRRISSRFSRARRNPVTRKVVPHHGVDFAAAAGTPVAAAADGRVIFVGWSGALGKTVKIRHGSEYVTVYGHLSRYARSVRTGATVRQNDVIGYVGSTGRATGPHLHYTMLVSGRAVDPMTFRNPPVEPLPDQDRPRLEAMVRKYRPSLYPRAFRAEPASAAP
jgi:murein DD-endopeptidase MepM/ murein hydrolase activator NlpD